MNSLGAFEKVPCKYDKSSEADRARLRKVFDMYDRNKDGSIDLEEVREALAPLAVADGAVLRVLKRLATTKSRSTSLRRTCRRQTPHFASLSHRSWHRHVDRHVHRHVHRQVYRHA